MPLKRCHLEVSAEQLPPGPAPGRQGPVPGLPLLRAVQAPMFCPAVGSDGVGGVGVGVGLGLGWGLGLGVGVGVGVAVGVGVGVELGGLGSAVVVGGWGFGGWCWE